MCISCGLLCIDCEPGFFNPKKSKNGDSRLFRYPVIKEIGNHTRIKNPIDQFVILSIEGDTIRINIKEDYYELGYPRFFEVLQ